jgi:acyl transferase domain-containing protein
LIKAILALKHRELPPSLHFEQSNPKIDFPHSPFYVNTRLNEWKAGQTPRRAGVSSFGIGGTNAHVILEEAPEMATGSAARAWQLIPLSAKTPAALEAECKNLADHVRRHPELNLADVAYTLQVGRREFECRRMLLGRNRDELLAGLEAPGQSRTTENGSEPRHRPIVFMFPGQGSQHVNMARDLYENEPSFQSEVDRCCELLFSRLGFDLRRVLYPEKGQEEAATQRLQETAVTQPALFVIEFALARLWMSWGIKPEGLIGHSIGEYVAACLAEVFTLEDALELVVERGRLMQSMPTGVMLAVPLPEAALLSILPSGLSLAAVNGPSLCVVSGLKSEVEAFRTVLEASGTNGIVLRTSHAFHSSMMDSMLRPFAEYVGRVKRGRPTIPIISNLTGTWISPSEATDPEYWAKHLRNTVRFADGVRELLKEPGRVLLEVGPGTTLCSLSKIQRTPSSGCEILPSLGQIHEQRPGISCMLATLGQLWLNQAKVDWLHFSAREHRRRIHLPPYPFQGERYWFQGKKPESEKSSPSSFASKNPEMADWFYIPSWQRLAPLQPIREPIQPRIWLIFLDDGNLASSTASRLAQYSQKVITIRAGQSFETVDGGFILNPSRPDDYERLIVELQRNGQSPQHVAHFWSVTTNAPSLKSGQESFERDRNLGFDSLIFLAQAIYRHQIGHDIDIHLVSNHVQDVLGGEIVSPAKAMLLGPCKVVSQEHPNLVCRSIDVVLSETETTSHQPLVEQLLTELLSGDKESFVAYRGRHRWAQRFERTRIEDVQATSEKIRDRGVYLITGGFGKIGFLLAQHLATSRRAKLVLMGRSFFPARQSWADWLEQHGPEDPVFQRIQKVKALEALGSEVLVLVADAADKNQFEAGIMAAQERFGEINGVFHAAGITDPGQFKFLSDIDKENCELHFRPKVHGLMVIEQVLRGKPLDFVVLLSSLSTVLGGLRMAVYAGANHFMDAFAWTQNCSGRTSWISVNWDGWMNDATKGPSTPDSTVAKFGLTPVEGIAAFQRILGTTGFTQIVVSTGDLNSRLHNWVRIQSPGSRKDSALGRASAGHARPTLQTDYVPPQNEMERTVAGIWQELLGIEKVGVRDNFFDLGGHSLLGTQVISRVREIFGVQLSPRSVYDAPTVGAIAGLIRELSDDDVANTEKISKLLERVEQLSETELKRLGTPDHS